MTFRCSDLDRILECPGSISLVPRVAPRKGEDGAEGSALHFISAEMLVAQLGATAPENGLGEYAPTWPTLKFSKWIAEYYVRHVRENCPPDWSLEVEAGLAYDFDGFTLSGHIDCVAISPDGTEAIGWDLKTGYDPVDEAEQNWQMLGYVVLLKRAYPRLHRVTFHIVQPRNDEDEGFQRVSSVTLQDDFSAAPFSVLENAVATLAVKIDAATHASTTLNSGRKQCRFCAAKLQCPATIGDRDQMKLTMTKTQLAAIEREPNDQLLADWVMVGRVVGQAIDDAEKIAKERIATVGEIAASDGTRISVKTQRGSYKILDHAALWATLKELLPEEMLAVCAKWSFSNVKDKIAEHLNVPKSGKAAVTSETVFDAKVRTFVEQGERKIFQYR